MAGRRDARGEPCGLRRHRRRRGRTLRHVARAAAAERAGRRRAAAADSAQAAPRRPGARRTPLGGGGRRLAQPCAGAPRPPSQGAGRGDGGLRGGAGGAAGEGAAHGAARRQQRGGRPRPLRLEGRAGAARLSRRDRAVGRGLPEVKLRVGLSPCPNDTFAFHGLLSGAVRAEGLDLEFRLHDIEELNQALARGDLDVAKSSFFAAQRHGREFGVLPVGAAIGFGVGPLLVARAAGPPPGPDDRVLAPGA
ncbi:MAG: hypothetical protein FJ293_15190, partial [Planctomycetes bacterium]|nr:hypothetical protein [Planctomycetota bacterium]